MTTNTKPTNEAYRAILFDNDRVGCFLATSETLQFVTVFRDTDCTNPDRTITVETTSVQLKWDRHEGKISYWNLIDPISELPRLKRVPPEKDLKKPMFFLGLVRPGPYRNSHTQSFPAGTPLAIPTREMWGIIDDEGCATRL